MSDPAEASGGGGEQGQETEVVLLHCGKQRLEPVNLGAIYHVELLGSLFLDPPVRQHAGAVDKAGDRSDPGPCVGDCFRHCLAVTDVDRAVHDFGAGIFDALHIAEQFSVCQE